jgi:hypothetical protein
MPRVITLALQNTGTHAMSIPLDTTRLITVPTPRPGLPFTLVGLNQTESAAWAAACKTPQVAGWTGAGLLIITDIPMTPEDSRREIID